MLVNKKATSDDTVILSNYYARKLLRKINQTPTVFHKKESLFSYPITTTNINEQINKINPDIVHLHWVNDGFVNIQEISKIKQPVFWTLHDMWPFTGGCHYSNGCSKFSAQCGECPVINSNNQHDLSYKLLKKKKDLFEEIDLTIICPSNWIKSKSEKSKVFSRKDHYVIPNPLDLDIFVRTQHLKNELGFLPDVPLLLFGAINSTDDKRKGFTYLIQALELLKKSNDNVQIGIFGSDKNSLNVEIPFHHRFLGNISSTKTLSELYSIADVFLAPSLEEVWGQTISEAMACGTPTVAFSGTGPDDIITHFKNGYLAQNKNPEDFANGINWALEQKEIKESCRKRAEDLFDAKVIALKTIEIYKKRLNELI